MPIYDNSDFSFPVPTWTSEDVEVLFSLEPRFVEGALNLISYMVGERGYTQDVTIDLILVFHSIVNLTGGNYSFDDTEAIVALCSEFCMIDCVYENQVLSAVELLDNGVLFLGMHGDSTVAIDAAVCLSERRTSIFSHPATLPSLSLFGIWEEYAVTILDCLLTNKSLSASISFLMKTATAHGLDVSSDIEFIDVLRKLCSVGLFTVSISKSGSADVTIVRQPAGLFLLFSDRVEMARKLSLL